MDDLDRMTGAVLSRIADANARYRSRRRHAAVLAIGLAVLSLHAPPQPSPPQGRTWNQGCSDPVDTGALRDLTDDSGGRTEIIRNPRDLDAATASIAAELSQQYYLGYLSTGKKDGRWHSIRVEVRNGQYRIRARRGYVAS